ncbi:MAG: DUF4388 domain-containing protein [Acidobacteriota bacterium]
MGISGNLKTMVLAELLQWLSQGQKTGTLLIDNGRIEKKIFFDHGSIISSASTDRGEYLGHFLVGTGYVSEDQVNEAVARQKDEKKLLGQILVDIGAVPEDDLAQMLRLKAEESIYDIFTWTEGDFRFLDGELPAQTMIRMDLDVQWIVLEGSRRLDEWNRLREWVPSDMCIPVTVVDLASIEIEDADRRILECVDDDSTIEEISEQTHTTLFLTTQAVAHHAELGHLKVVKPRTIEVETVVEKIVEKVVEKQVRVEVPVAQPMMAHAGMPMQMGMPQQPMPMPAAPQQVMPQQAAPMPAAPMQAAPQPAAPQPASGGFSIPATSAAANVPDNEAGRLVRQAEELLHNGDLAAALAAYRQAKDAEGAKTVASAVNEGETKVRQALQKEGVSVKAKPKMLSGMEMLTQIQLSPQEGFMLTRVDGRTDIQSLLKISPMPKMDALFLFYRLKKDGHIGF